MENEFLDYLRQMGQAGQDKPNYPDVNPIESLGYGTPDMNTPFSQEAPYNPELSYGQNPAPYIPNMTSGDNAGPYMPTIGTPRRQGTTSQHGAYKSTPGQIAAYIREAAAKRNIDPEIALRIAEHEGGYDDEDPARRGTFATGSSWWPFQLHYGGAGTPYARFGDTAGMGNDFSERFGYEPGDPSAVWDSIDFALDHAARYGWSAWYGRGPAGIGEWDGIPGGPK